MSQTKTPCIGICSTTSVGDFVCRGCKRYAFEVINWVTYAETEKNAVLSRIEKLTCQIIAEKVKVDSPALLSAGLEHRRIPYNESLSPYCWVHNLLKKYHLTASVSLQEFGISARPGFDQLNVLELAEVVDQELLTLSQAHYNRYMQESGLLRGELESA